MILTIYHILTFPGHLVGVQQVSGGLAHVAISFLQNVWELKITRFHLTRQTPAVLKYVLFFVREKKK